MVCTVEMLSCPARIYLGVRKVYRYSRVTFTVIGLSVNAPFSKRFYCPGV